MSYSLSNKCAKNLCKWTVLVHLIIENMITCFFETQCVFKWIFPEAQIYTNKNLAIANRLRVSCAHNMLRAPIGINITPWP